MTCATALVITGVCLTAVAAAQLPPTADDAVILAKERLRIHRNAQLHGGQIVVNDAGGVAIVSPWFRMLPGTQLAVDSIRIHHDHPFGPVLYDVFYNSFDDPVGTTQIQGSENTPILLSDFPKGGFPFYPFPPIVPVTPGSLNVRIHESEGSVTLTKGNYGRIRVGRRGVAVFNGGTYNIEALRIGRNGKALFNAGTTLNIKERFRASRGVVFVPNPDLTAFNPRCIVVNVESTRTARFSWSASVRAVVNAPAAKLWLGRRGEFEGNFTGAQVAIGRNVNLQPAPPLVDPCPYP